VEISNSITLKRLKTHTVHLTAESVLEPPSCLISKAIWSPSFHPLPLAALLTTVQVSFMKMEISRDRESLLMLHSRFLLRSYAEMPLSQITLLTSKRK
jgi:hypothetical protein